MPGSSDKENSSAASSECGNGENCNGNGEDEDDPMDDGAIALQLDQNHKGKEVVNQVSSPENRENDPIPMDDDGKIALQSDRKQKGKNQVEVDYSPEISVNESTTERGTIPD